MADEFDHLKAAGSCLQELGRDDISVERKAQYAMEAAAHALTSIASDVRTLMVSFVLMSAVLKHEAAKAKPEGE